MSRIIDYMRAETGKLIQEFAAAQSKGEGTAQEVADFRENYFNKLIERYFPFPYKIAKGQIIDASGAKSPSIDCNILGPSHPYLVGPNGKFEIILADGVDTAIELKPDLKSMEELKRGLIQIKGVKKLRRQKPGIFENLITGPDKDRLIELAKFCPAFLFAMTAPPPKVLAKRIETAMKDCEITVDQLPDYIVINGSGIVVISKHANSVHYPYKGLLFEDWGDLSIAGMIVKLNSVVGAQPRLAEPPLSWYLKSLQPTQGTELLPLSNCA
jgi:hypothetical protein